MTGNCFILSAAFRRKIAFSLWPSLIAHSINVTTPKMKIWTSDAHWNSALNNNSSKGEHPEHQRPPVEAELKEEKKFQDGAGSGQLSWPPIGFWWAVVWSLLGLLVVSSSVYCSIKSRWFQSQLTRLRPATTGAASFCKRRVVKSSRAEKDSVKMGWSVEDFDHWTTSLSIPPPPPQLPRHEDERLLLAVVSCHQRT